MFRKTSYLVYLGIKSPGFLMLLVGFPWNLVISMPKPAIEPPGWRPRTIDFGAIAPYAMQPWNSETSVERRPWDFGDIISHVDVLWKWWENHPKCHGENASMFGNDPTWPEISRGWLTGQEGVKICNFRWFKIPSGVHQTWFAGTSTVYRCCSQL